MAINIKTWGPLAAAIVLGGFAAKAGYDVMSRRPPEKVVVQKVSRVAIAKEDIAAGTELTVGDVAISNVPEATATTGTFDSADRLAKRVTSVTIKKGQPIFEAMLAPEGSGSGLTAVVPEGMRAVTMEINEVSGVAGLIMPGCRVDVVSTFPNENGQMMTKTVCKALKIVAVGRKYSDSKTNQNQAAQPANGEEAPMFRSVTLLVTAHEAEVLDLAAHTGSPRLVLRSSHDTKDEEQGGMSEGVTVAELRGGKSTAAIAPQQLNPWSDFFSKLVNEVSPKSSPQVADGRLTDPAGLFGQPATQPTRQVTIIRNTREQSVQMNVDHDRGTSIANTDTSSEIPGK